MNSHIEETFASIIGLSAYIFAHFTGIRFEYLQVQAQPVDLIDKCLNVLFGVITAVVAYFAVYGIKKFITHEGIKTNKNKQNLK